MNLLSYLIAPLQVVVLFFAPHAVGAKPLQMRMHARAHALGSGSAPTSTLPLTKVSCAAPSAAHTAARLRVASIAYPSSTHRVNAKPIHAVRVVRNIDTSLPADRAGRMVVSGRFADVCAELDRMAKLGMRSA